MKDNRYLAAAAPLVLWLFAFGVLAEGARLVLPHVGPSLDFAAGRSVFAHIADRRLTPIPVVQNAPGAWGLLAVYVSGFGLACTAYVAILRLPQLHPAYVWGTFAAGALAAAAIPFFPTTDPYAYALYALEAGPLHLNPYAVHALAPSSSAWSAALMQIFPDPGAYVRHCNYGPVATLALATLALPLAHAPLVVFLYVERLFGALCVAATGVALARTAPEGEGVRRAAAYVLHPLVLCEFVAFAHGDSFMLALLAFAFVAWRRNSYFWAAALCVAATATRGVAALALVVMFVAAMRTQPRALAGVFAGTIFGAFVTCWISLESFGAVSLGAAPAFNSFSAPFVFAATDLGLSNPLSTGVFLEAGLGLILMAFALLHWWTKPAGSALSWLPFGALAALPAIYPHYLGWVAGAAALTTDRRVTVVARVATFAAPLWYAARMNLIAPPQPFAPAYAVLLFLTWGSVIAAFAFSSGADRKSFALHLRRA